MNKKFAIYCSGNANRVIKIYNQCLLKEYNFEFLLYDGGMEEVKELLIQKFKNKNLIFSKNNFEISDLLYKEMTLKNVDFLFSFGTQLLKGDLLIKYNNRIINFHPSLLPSFKGLNAIDKALSTSVQILGNTAHFIDSGVDTGLIIMQSVMLRSNYQTYDDVLDMQIPMFFKIWDMLNQDAITVKNNKIEFKNNPKKNRLFSL